jgi:hypothetical protein
MAHDGRAMGTPRIQDFVEALREQSEWIWAPGEGPAGSDLGAGLTGAQTSIYERGRAAVEAAIPLLDGLVPLRQTVDPGELEGLRTVVRHEMAELVSELGMAGGPRVLRIDVLFDLLLGPDSAVDPVGVGGVLGTLRDLFGLTPQLVTEIGEEQNLTDFVLIADYVGGIRQRWEVARPFFDRRDWAYIGDSRIRIMRALAVVAESVDELRSALDSVSMGHARRAVTIVHVAGEAPLTLAEFLNWIHRFAAEEGPALVRDRRRSGAEALASTAVSLRAVLRGARPGLRTLLEVVATQIDQVERDLERLYEEAMLVTEETSPSIDDVHPVQGSIGGQAKAEISGSGFAAGADVRLIRSGFSDIWSSEATVVNEGSIIVVFDLSGAAPGAWDIEVINPLGPSAVMPDGFLVLPADG